MPHCDTFYFFPEKKKKKNRMKWESLEGREKAGDRQEEGEAGGQQRSKGRPRGKLSQSAHRSALNNARAQGGAAGGSLLLQLRWGSGSPPHRWNQESRGGPRTPRAETHVFGGPTHPAACTWRLTSLVCTGPQGHEVPPSQLAASLEFSIHFSRPNPSIQYNFFYLFLF